MNSAVAYVRELSGTREKKNQSRVFWYPHGDVCCEFTILVGRLKYQGQLELDVHYICQFWIHDWFNQAEIVWMLRYLIFRMIWNQTSNLVELFGFEQRMESAKNWDEFQINRTILVIRVNGCANQICKSKKGILIQLRFLACWDIVTYTFLCDRMIRWMNLSYVSPGAKLPRMAHLAIKPP